MPGERWSRKEFSLLKSEYAKIAPDVSSFQAAAARIQHLFANPFRPVDGVRWQLEQRKDSLPRPGGKGSRKTYRGYKRGVVNTQTGFRIAGNAHPCPHCKTPLICNRCGNV